MLIRVNYMLQLYYSNFGQKFYEGIDYIQDGQLCFTSVKNGLYF